MKALLRRNLALFKLSTQISMEKRFDFFMQIFISPLCFSLVEMILWSSLFALTGSQTVMGHDAKSYLAYGLWGGFVARVSTSWSFEFKFVRDIEKGQINSTLLRPFSVYEFYLSDCLGQKFTFMLSLLFPLIFTYFLDLPFSWPGFTFALIILFFHLFFMYAISFLCGTLAFHMHQSESIIYSKNIFFWLLTGELFPLDLLPEPWRHLFINFPTACSTFIPVGLITQRLDLSYLSRGLFSLAWGILLANGLCFFVWKKSIRSYSGIGA